eukprot:CAMPEP_0198421504 /NCGR_PEP_ID=MMETSP1452-20131203/1680_1 /TAXON_ID=1181717 /ORGANISM="Synchroma pusillum, Strain CCMP3072" /LENGTH=240 /DNA_ID=CAMNT_0044141717 /DNA_START=66 /DNA_END=788 /DNA_ORIENTATION=-
MRVLALAACVATAYAFVGRPSAVRSSSVRSMKMEEEMSTALPFDKRPINLDGSLPGDVGFDPAGFSNNPPLPWLIGGDGARSLKWYREAELVHGRVAMLAFLGWITPEYLHIPAPVFEEKNPLAALYTAPGAGLVQISMAIFLIEVWRIKRVIRGDKEAGDLGLGQGEGRWNPLKLSFSDEEYRLMQVREIKHGRLAMFGILGCILQAKASGVGVITQLGSAFSVPSGRDQLPSFFPEGI